MKKRLVFVQAGDYSRAFDAFASGGAEDYYAQRYTTDFVTALARRVDVEQVSVFTFLDDAPRLSFEHGVTTWGVELYPARGTPRFRELLRELEGAQPTHVVVGSPMRPVIRWALERGVRVLPLLADSFRAQGLKAQVQHSMVSRTLNDPRLRFVGNHNLAASQDLARIGVSPHKILPYDWPALLTADGYAPKSAPRADAVLRILYVGMLMEAKGVGDVIRALHALVKRGVRATLDIAGRGEQPMFEALARELGVAEHVHFRGRLPHEQVLQSMRDSDIVVVPSRHAYPEGLPMTLYEALCTRTPLVTSDHPMFRLRLTHEVNALIFPERDAEALALAIERLLREPALYERLSAQAARASAKFLCPLKWDQLITHWLADGADDATLASYSLASDRYDPARAVRAVDAPALAQTL